MRRVLWVLGVLTVLVVGAYVGAYVAAGPGIARGTSVLGVGIGGRTHAEAVALLGRELRDELTTPMPVRAGDAQTAILPPEAGLTLDAAATVAAAQARSWHPGELVDALVGGDEVAPVVSVDPAALRRAVARAAAQLDREPVEGEVSFDRSTDVVRVEPQEGITVDQAGAAERIVGAFPRHLRAGADSPAVAVRLPAEITAPAVDLAEVDRVVTEVAEPAVSAPVELTVEDLTLRIRPRAIARALTFNADAAGTLQPELDGARLRAGIAHELAAVEQPAQDASFDVSSGRPRVVPAQQGRAVRSRSLAAAVLPVLTMTGPARAATVELEVSQPEVGTAAARRLGVRELVAAYTTYYPSDFPPRLINIHRAAELMDGTLVLPGETFSFNETVGERTAERGFAAGFIIDNGRIEVDYGGGVSQLATTVFNAAFFAGLEIVEHNPHSFYISRYPEGRESTIAWGVKDLRVRNDSEPGVFLTTSYTNTSVTVRVWGTKRYRIEATTGPRYDIEPYRIEYDPRPAGTDQGDCVPTEGVPGFKVVVHRLFYVGGRQVRSEEFRTTYNPEHEVRCAG